MLARPVRAHVLMGLDRLDELVSNLVIGVEGRERVLEDHRDVVSPDFAKRFVVQVQEVASLEA